jgi:hypothetical protein
MNRRRSFTLHPVDRALMGEFQYGDMLVRRKSLDEHAKHSRKLLGILESYKYAGIFPRDTRPIGDYLEHTLLRGDGKEEVAGRYLGVVLPGGSYQYMRLDGESIGVDKDRLEPPDEINILTDTCLFSASTATATLDDGEVVSLVAPRTEISCRVRELHISDRMCFYEMDSIVRLTDLIASMRDGNKAYRKVFVAMPTVEYYFYLMNAYNKGFITKEMMDEWIGQVDRQSGRIVRAIGKRIGLGTDNCQPLGSVERYVKDCVSGGAPVDFGKVKDMLSRSGLWREVILHTKPKEWKDLNYTNYVVAVLECALSSQNRNRLTVYVENPSEQRILRNAAKIAKQLRRQEPRSEFRVLGVYPHEKVFVPADDVTSRVFPRLYYLGKEQLSERSFARQIIECNRRKLQYFAK